MIFCFDFLFRVTFLPSSDTNFEVKNLNSNHAKKDIRTNKRKQPDEKNVVQKEFKDLCQISVDKKSKNADVFNGALNKENPTFNKKKIQVTTTEKIAKKPRLSKYAKEMQGIDNKPQSSATNDDTMKKNKRNYNKSPMKKSATNKKTGT